MNILILGCGFTGKAIAERLKHKHNLRLTTRSKENLDSLLPLSKDCHIFDGSQWNLLDGQDVVIVCIASQGKDFKETYLKTAEGLLTALKSNTSVRQIIYTSSSSVYAESQGGYVDEKSPLNNDAINSRILIETEDILLKCQTQNRHVTLFRLGEIYGKERSLEHKARARSDKIVHILKTNYTNMTHVDEIARATDFAIDHHLNGIYNLAHDEHPTREALYRSLCEKYHLRMPRFEYDEKVGRHFRNKRVSSEKICALMGPLNRIDLGSS